jgi:uncharacterized protein YdaU (DUF1376 family)
MALRNQPYLPLYVQDFMTDEKLSLCSASTTGVYIRIMCLMHKSKEYGKILLKQKHKQTNKQVLDFALLIAKNLPYEWSVVQEALIELIEEEVLSIEGDYLVQKRMVKDGEISDKRALAGKTGGEKLQNKYKDFAKANTKANTQANSEYENEYEIENEIEIDNKSVVAKILKIHKNKNPGYPESLEDDSPAILGISKFICNQLSISFQPQEPETVRKILEAWERIAEFISQDDFYRDQSLKSIKNQIQTITQKIKNGSANNKNGSKPGGKVTGAQLNEVFTKRYKQGESVRHTG